MTKHVNYQRKKYSFSTWTLLLCMLLALTSLFVFTTGLADTNVAYGLEFSDTWKDYIDVSWYTPNTVAGTIEDPFIIESASQLAGLASLVRGAVVGRPEPISFENKYIWINNESGRISLTSHYWIPIGVYSGQGSVFYSFKGTLDFGRYTDLEGYAATPSDGYLVGSGEICDMLFNSGKADGCGYSGGFLGFIDDGAIVKNINFDNCTSYMDSTGPRHVAIVAGYSKGMLDSIVTENTCLVEVLTPGASMGSGDSFDAGGIVGYYNYSPPNTYNPALIVDYSDCKRCIINCENNAVVKNGYSAGGIAGSYSSSYNKGSIPEYLPDLKIMNCVNNGAVFGRFAGGIVGVSNAPMGNPSVSFCYNTGAVTGLESTGGIVAKCAGGLAGVYQCYNEGAVKYDNYTSFVTGGSSPVYLGNASIVSCYVGGIVGDMASDMARVDKCYNIGTVGTVGTINEGVTVSIGAVVGKTESNEISNVRITNCYYLENVTIGNVGIGKASGANTGFSSSGTACKTEVEMKQSSTYVGWDFGNSVARQSNLIGNIFYPWRSTEGDYPKLTIRNAKISIHLTDNDIIYDAQTIASGLERPSDWDYTFLAVNNIGGSLVDVSYTGQKNVVYYGSVVDGNVTMLQGVPKNAGTYRVYIIVDGYFSDGFNLKYCFGYTFQQFTIEQREINVAPLDGLKKTYGNTYSVFGGDKVELVSDTSSMNEELAAECEALTFSGGFARSEGEAVGTYSYYNQTVACANANFKAVFVKIVNEIERKFEIEKATLYVTVNDLSVTYGTETINGSFSYVGLKTSANGATVDDTINSVVSVGGYSVDTSVVSVAGKNYPNVGVYLNALTLNSPTLLSGNYKLEVADADLTVTIANLTIAIANKTKIYGNTMQVSELSIDSDNVVGLMYSEILEDVVSISALTSAGLVATASVNNYPITFVQYPTSENYNVQVTQGILTVSKKTIAVNKESVVISEQTFDPNVDTISAPGITFIGVLAADEASVSARVVFKYENGGNAGTNIALIDPLIVFEQTVTNYTVDTSNLIGVYFATINQADLTVKFEDQIIVYGAQLLSGSTDIQTNYVSYNGVTGDYAKYNLGGTFTTNFAALNINSILPTTYDEHGFDSCSYNGTVQMHTALVLNVSGYSSTNYNISYQPGKLFIVKRTLILGNLSVRDKAYDGTTNATPIRTPTISNKVSADDIRLDDSALRMRFVSANASESADYYIETISLIGADIGNYIMPYSNHVPDTEPNIIGSAKITKVALNLHINAATKLYLDPVPTLSFDSTLTTGWVASESFATYGVTEAQLQGIQLTTTATAESAVGDYRITVNESTIPTALKLNYIVGTSSNAMLHVAKINYNSSEIVPLLDGVTLSSLNSTFDYDDANHSFSVSIGKIAESIGYTVQYTSGDSGVAASNTPHLFRDGGKHYTFAATVSVGNNYSIDNANSYTTDNYGFTINKIRISVKVDDVVIDTMDEIPGFSFSVIEGNLIGDDTVNDIGTPVFECAAQNGSPAGKYPINIKGDFVSKNYQIDDKLPGTLTIEQFVVDVDNENLVTEGSVGFIDLPTGATFEVSEYGVDSEKAAGYADKVNAYQEKYMAVLIIEPSFSGIADGKTVETRIEVPSRYNEDDTLLLVVLGEDGSISRVMATYQDGYVYFKAYSDRTYMLIVKDTYIDKSLLIIIIAAGGATVAAAVVIAIIVTKKKAKKRALEKAKKEREFAKLIGE